MRKPDTGRLGRTRTPIILKRKLGRGKHSYYSGVGGNQNWIARCKVEDGDEKKNGSTLEGIRGGDHGNIAWEGSQDSSVASKVKRPNLLFKEKVCRGGQKTSRKRRVWTHKRVKTVVEERKCWVNIANGPPKTL